MLEFSRFFETAKINADPSDNDGVLSGSITGGAGTGSNWKVNKIILDEPIMFYIHTKLMEV